jgi:hypothetical protein
MSWKNSNPNKLIDTFKNHIHMARAKKVEFAKPTESTPKAPVQTEAEPPAKAEPEPAREPQGTEPVKSTPYPGQVTGEKSIDGKKYLLIDGSYTPLEGKETSKEYLRWRLRNNTDKLTKFEGYWALESQGKAVAIPVLKTRAPRKRAPKEAIPVPAV